MAQDFHAAFGLGNDDKTINTLDAGGVLFFSVKGLVEELKDRDAQHQKDLAGRDASRPGMLGLTEITKPSR